MALACRHVPVIGSALLASFLQCGQSAKQQQEVVVEAVAVEKEVVDAGGECEGERGECEGKEKEKKG